ncbi:MAG: Nif3-like dinuclear metal center hexameric protein [Melioribacteraceae bacterium]|nr:Nif3-like dinuclear metal center hexameric protein [Melioribacteraceae bacterium]
MLLKELISHIESLAPPGIAWENDNIGLQVGASDTKLSNILLALDINREVLKQAITKNCNLIFTHHPFLFKPLKKIDISKDPKSQIVEELIINKISLYSAHTNLDFIKNGVSYELANRLKLNNIRFLEVSKSNQYKLVVFVPEKFLDKVSEAVFKSGGGIIGEYSNCSYRLIGAGTFRGSENSNPAIGKKNKFETVNEIRLETIVEKWNLSKVISSLIKAHPYEEPAYDVYPLENHNVNFGFGAVGELQKSMTQKEFLAFVIGQLKLKNLRFANGKPGKVKKVAVCGGSGSELLGSAVFTGADAFITSDIKYHTFQDAENKILLIDAGHYETEIHVLNYVKNYLNKLIASTGENISVYKYTGTTNPVKFYNN